MKLGTNCKVHRHWSRVPIELHHVWPLGDGGPNLPSNLISVCANGHYAIHACLDLLRHGEHKLTWRQTISFGRKVRAYAQQGWAQIELELTKKSRPPNALRPGE